MLVTKGALHLADRFRIKKIGLIVLIFNMLYCSSIHIYNMVFHYGYWGVDHAAYIMILTCKMSSLGYLYQDGQKENQEYLTKGQLERSLSYVPSLKEIFAYTFDPMSNLGGPFSEFTLYMDFINLRKQYANIPRTLLNPFLTWSVGFIFIGLNIVINKAGFDA